MNSASELDSLRSQVVDLSRELAERDQALRERGRHLDSELQDLREQSKQLHTIITGTAAETGDDFFPALVTQLTSLLGMAYAVVGEIQQDSVKKKIRTIAVAAGGTLVDNFEYDLMGTPCETALDRASACFERDVQASFPAFTRLSQLNVEGYCGVSIRAKSGAVVGLLVVMDRKPMCNTEWVHALLTIFAPRVGAELQRRQAERELKQQQRHLVEAQTVAHIGSWDWDIASGAMEWSDEQFRIFGYEPNAISATDETFLAALHPDDHDRVVASINDALEGKTSLDVECRVVCPDGEIRTVHYLGKIGRAHV
jgi:GAF domain-containing protein